MGTRSLTRVREDAVDGPVLVTMYRQYDGYPEGHGKELAEWLADAVIINGIGSNPPPRAANGMGCLAAQMVAHFKGDDPLGGCYLYPADCGDVWQEFEYDVYPVGAELAVKVTPTGGGEPLYDGLAANYPWL